MPKPGIRYNIPPENQPQPTSPVPSPTTDPNPVPSPTTDPGIPIGSTTLPTDPNPGGSTETAPPHRRSTPPDYNSYSDPDTGEFDMEGFRRDYTEWSSTAPTEDYKFDIDKTDPETGEFVGAGAQIPDAPTSTTPAPIDSPISTNPDRTQAGAAQDVVDAYHQGRINEMDAAKQNQARAEGIYTDIGATTDAATAEIDTVRTDLEARQVAFDRDLDLARTKLDNIVPDTMDQFDALDRRLQTDITQSFGRVEDQFAAAMDKVLEGRTAAMQSAIQGIQGNIATTIAQISANPDLSSAQKSSMIAQTQMQGAMALVPAVGSQIAAFNKMEADLATSFGSMSASLEQTGLQAKSQLGLAQGGAFAETTVATQELTNQLLNTAANSDAAYANSQSTLLATRSNLEMTGQSLQMEMIPEMYEPWYDPTGTAQLVQQQNIDLLDRDWEMNMGEFAMGLNVAVLKMQEGTPASRFLDSVGSALAEQGLLAAGVMTAFELAGIGIGDGGRNYI